MARLTDMVEQEEVVTTEEVEYTTKDALIEALETLIEMVEEDILSEDEVEVLDEAVDFITEDFDGEDVEEELTEKKMSAKAKAKARKYRQKNRMKLKKIAKLKKKCMVKIAGKEGMTCNSKGQVKRIDKARSKAAKRGARSR